jgi:hypothetical protein
MSNAHAKGKDLKKPGIGPKPEFPVPQKGSSRSKLLLAVVGRI